MSQTKRVAALEERVEQLEFTLGRVLALVEKNKIEYDGLCDALTRKTLEKLQNENANNSQPENAAEPS